MSRKKKKPGSGKNRKRLERELIDAFSQNPKQPLNYKQVAKKLETSDPHTRQLIAELLYELTAREILKEVSRGKFKLAKPMAFIIGRVDMNQSGSAYVISDEVEEDVFIPPKFVGQALHGDEVKVFLLARKKRKSPEGQIVEVIKRAKMEFVGIIERTKDYGFLVPDSRKMLLDIYIAPGKLNGAKHGEKAIARITDWPKEASSPFGEVIQVLGNPLSNEVEMQSILADNGFPLQFPDEVEAVANQISLDIPEEEIAKRRDLREVPTFTIDPVDAKDFDDALSVRTLENGNLEIGVHIADVTHYVQPGDAIDREAVERATSVYLVDRVIPMLPEVLSNRVCSLRPHEEKLTYSCLFELNERAEVVNEWIGRTVIYSDRRFTYEEAQEVIETGTGDFSEALVSVNALAVKLREQRMKKGAIAFDKVEIRFLLDEEKMPESIYFKMQKEANHLIEEFMLLANRTVATRIGKPNDESRPRTFVYRIHDTPDPEKLADFSQFIRRFGYRYTFSKPNTIATELNQLLQEVKGKGEENMIETLAIRSMAKAVYSTDNIGHYGLSFPYYTHFTSPIRRYPDVLVHRLLTHYLDDGKSVSEAKYEKLCQHCSEQERKAAEAERDSIKFYQALYMKDSVGEEFNGVISGVTEWGIYVEIVENKCEGMIRLREISGDYFYFDEGNYRIVGNNTGQVYQLGDSVKIRVKYVDLANKRMDFELVDPDLED